MSILIEGLLIENSLTLLIENLEDNIWGTQNAEGNVQELLDFIKEQNYPTVNIPLDKIYKMAGWGEDMSDVYNSKGIRYTDLPPKEKEEYRNLINAQIDRASLQYPIVLAVTGNKIKAIVDGHHRVQKAYKLGNKEIKAVLIPEKDLNKRFSKS